MSEAKKKTLAFVAEIDPYELAVRLMVIGIGAHPTDKETRSNREIIMAAKKRWPSGCGPFPFDLMAQEAIRFMGESIVKASTPQ